MRTVSRTASQGWRRLRTVLPRGDALPERLWRQWDRGLHVVLWLHLPLLATVGWIRGGSVTHLGLDLAVLAVVTAVTHLPRSRSVRSCLVSFALLTCSALMVHLSGGLTEMHFHFFVTVSLIALYSDWRPYLLAVGFVLFHHGVLGALAPDSIYRHPAAAAQPVRWAAMHGAFILAASAAQLVLWRANEQTRRLYREALHDALHDPLTGLANRREFHDRLNRAVEGAERAPGSVAVLLVDLDGFKGVNDRLGHAAGDELLITVADRLRHCVRPGDLLARLGGDEFTVLLERLDRPEDAMVVARRILAVLQAPIDLGTEAADVSASIGIAQHGDGNHDARSLVRAADAAMYRAKQRGGGRAERTPANDLAVELFPAPDPDAPGVTAPWRT